MSISGEWVTQTGSKLAGWNTNFPARTEPCANVAFIDKVQLWFPDEPSETDLKKLRSCCAGWVDVDHEWMKGHSNWRCRLQLNQPEPDAFKLLERIADHCLINGLEIALDLTLGDREEVCDLRQFIDAVLVKPKPGKQGTDDAGRRWPLDYRGTLYFDRPGSPTNLVVYSDRPSKMSDQPCVHIEYRVKGKGAVKRFGVSRPGDLASLNLKTFWAKHLKLETIHRDPSVVGEEFLRGNPTYQTRRPPISQRKVGVMILRASAVTENGGSAQGLREWSRGCRWFRTAACVRRLDNTRYLPADSETPSERRLNGRRRRIGRCNGGTARDLEIPDDLWIKMNLLIPRRINTHKYGGGRPRRSDRSCMTAILQVTRGMCSWRDVGQLEICPSSTAHDRMMEWIDSGLFEQMRVVGLDEHEYLDNVDWKILSRNSYSDRE